MGRKIQNATWHFDKLESKILVYIWFIANF